MPGWRSPSTSIIKALAKKYLGADELSTGLEGLTKAATEILKDEIKTYTSRQKGMEEFKEELAKYVQKSGEKPLIFFVDELDRCRPDYAVELLEQIKHFFTIPGIVFVLAIDKKQLANAVTGFYRSPQMNTEDYLRRFFDLEISIPTPDTRHFCRYLYDYYGFKTFFDLPERQRHFGQKTEETIFIDMAASLFDSKKLTLRQQDKLFAIARLGLRAFQSNAILFPETYLLLTYMKAYYPGLYRDIVERKLNLQSFANGLEQIIPTASEMEDIDTYRKPVAILIHLYFYYYREKYDDIKLIVKGSSNESTDELSVTFNGVLRESNEWFRDWLTNDRRRDLTSIPITHLTNKIDLIEELKGEKA